MTTTLNAWVFPGGSGDRAYLSDVGKFRTEVGVAWTIALFMRQDGLTPGEDGTLVSLRSVLNNARNHAFRFDDGANRVSYTYNLGSEQAGSGTDSVSATTWYLVALTYPGTGSTVTLRLISTAGSQIASGTGTASSLANDAHTQQMTLGAEYNGASTALELRGRICLPLIVRGTALSQAQLEGYAADPLNAGDVILATYGASNITWFDDTNNDRGSGGATITLEGSVSLGSANGPTVTDRTPPANHPDIESVDWYNTVYVGQQGLKINVSNFGSSLPLVTITSSPTLSAGTPLPVRSFNSGMIVLRSLDDLTVTGPAYIWVTNQTPGEDFGQAGVLPIVVHPDPGPTTIELRTTPGAITIPEDTPYTEDLSTIPYLRTAQETLIYSVDGQPSGLSIDPDTGVLSGTVSDSEGSYVITVTCMDTQGHFTTVVFPMTVVSETAPAPTGRSTGSWGRRGRSA